MTGDGTARVVNVDEVHEFREGDRRTFGRNDEQCDIVAWGAIHDRRLSRVAGELWRQDGEMWVRNLSTAHDLQVTVPGSANLEPLPPRAHGTRGVARSLPAPEAWVHGPDGLELRVLQIAGAAPSAPAEPADTLEVTATYRPAPVPVNLLHVALAVCEPLLLGESAPATYRQVQERLGPPLAPLTYKAVRLRVETLVDLYLDHLPRHAARESARRMAEEPQLVDGTWRFPDKHTVPSVSRSIEPAYSELAALLVRRGLVSSAQLQSLPHAPGRTPVGASQSP